MHKRILIAVLYLGIAAVLSSCGGKSNDVAQPAAYNAPVELEVASTTRVDTAPGTSELLDPEFGCSGGGHLEYGLVNSHAARQP